MFHFVTASPCAHDVVPNLETDCNDTVEWFSVNVLQENPSKFDIILSSSSNIEKWSISQCIDDIISKPEPHVKILGVLLTISCLSVNMLVLAARKLQGN